MVRAFFRGVGWSIWILIVVSLLLGEGFLCLIFFTPIYLFMARCCSFGRRYSAKHAQAVRTLAASVRVSRSGHVCCNGRYA